ncbi:MAG: DUF481 domain-containing protein [bacterium]|nr:MAG: DUF481 domain-containing protein [bacterium]
MKRSTVFVLILGILACPAAVRAQEDRVSDQAELSYVETTGNTETVSLAAKNVLKYTFSEKLLGTWSLGALLVETDDVTTAEQYSTRVRLDYVLSDRLYSFADAGWFQDEPAGVSSRVDVGAGAGYWFLTGPEHKLQGEAGLTQTTEEFTDGTDNDFLGGRLFGKYAYSFREKNELSQSLEYLLDFDDTDNYAVNSETAFTSVMTDVLSLKTSYVINFDNEPPPGSEDTDTKLSVTLVVNL